MGCETYTGTFYGPALDLIRFGVAGWPAWAGFLAKTLSPRYLKNALSVSFETYTGTFYGPALGLIRFWAAGVGGLPNENLHMFSSPIGAISFTVCLVIY